MLRYKFKHIKFTLITYIDQLFIQNYHSIKNILFDNVMFFVSKLYFYFQDIQFLTFKLLIIMIILFTIIIITFIINTLDITMLSNFSRHHSYNYISIIQSPYDLLESTKGFYQLNIQTQYQIISRSLKYL